MYVSVPVTAAAAGLGLPPGAAPTGPECGSIAGLQRMLAELGVYMGAIDGALSASFVALCKSYAQSKGVPFSSGATISDAFCSAVAADWNARFYKPFSASLRQAVARTTTATPSYSRGMVSDGSMAIDPAALQCAFQGGVYDPATKKCSFPSRDTTNGGGTPADQLTAVEQCLSAGGGWLDDHCVFPDTGDRMDTQDARASISTGEEPGWWDKQDTPVKVAIIGGGVLVVVGIGYAVLR
jgi:hypothetical protein